jgi:hypothetical protein
MKNKLFHRYLGLAIILLLIFSDAKPVLAHGGEPRLELSVDRVNPGGVVDVRGVDFEPEETLTLTLVEAQQTIQMGEAVTDAEGIFLQIVTLPVDLPEGTYTFVVLHDEHQIVSPTLLVQGTPMIESEDGQRSEEDGLLAPMPTLVLGAPTLTLAGMPTPSPSGPAATSKLNYGTITFIGLIVVGTLVLLSFMRKRRA